MNATIERLRTEEADRQADKRLTTSEVATVVQGLRESRPLEQVARDSGLPTDDVLGVVAEFGTWLTHVRGGAKVETKEWWESERLFPANDMAEVVWIPLGFEKTAGHGRDVAKSLAAIVVSRPGDDEIGRFLARKYPSDTAVLTFPMVSVVWKFAQLGRLDDIDQVSPQSVYRRLVVQAFDLLHVAVADAQSAARTIASLSRATPEQVSASLDDVADAAAKLSWLQPRESGELTKLVDMARTESSLLRSLVARLRSLGREMASRPAEWYVESIASLNQGHVEQIARRGGLSVEGISRSEESAIRQRLSDMGLKSDADRLVPEGVRAVLSGNEDEFWHAMDLRASGDAAWRDVLAAAYGE